MNSRIRRDIRQASRQQRMCKIQPIAASWAAKCGFAAIVAMLLVRGANAALVGYWNFDEGIGTNANDFSPNSNHGAFATGGASGGFPAWVLNGGNTGAAGDHALRFSTTGTNSAFVRVPASVSLNSLNSSNTFTFATWAFEETNTNYGHIFVTTSDFAQRQWLFQTDNGGDQAYVWSTTVPAWQRPLGSQIANNQWIHLALTYDGTTMRYYKNAVLVNTLAVGSTFPAFTGELDLGGWRANGSTFGGRLDDMVVFNSVEDVTSIMNGTHPAMNPAQAVPEPASIAGWILLACSVFVFFVVRRKVASDRVVLRRMP